MKILHIIDSLGLGGAQTLVKGIFEKQKENKDIFLFALREREIKIDIDHPNVFVYPSSRKYSLRPLKELKKIIEKEKFDVLHCHLFRSQFTGYLLKKRYFPNIKLILHEHGEIFQNHITYDYFMTHAQKRVNTIIAVSKATKNELIKKANINPNKIVVLYNFVDTDKFNRKNITWDVKKEKGKLGIQKDEYVIGFMGRLAYVKGCDILIKALPGLNFKYKVLLAGDGPERKKLENLAKKLGVREKVIFLGYIHNPLWAYSMIDVVVMPSRSEASPMALNEARAMRLPIIGNNVLSINEFIITNKDGLLFKKDINKELVKKLRLIHKDTKLRNILKINSLMRVNEFSFKNYFEELKKFYIKIR